MKLVYEGSDTPVRLGDRFVLDGAELELVGIQRPHKPESTGRVILREAKNSWEHAYFPSVIGAEWINREDQRP